MSDPKTKMEPEAGSFYSRNDAAIVSIAISLKRIADKLETGAVDDLLDIIQNRLERTAHEAGMAFQNGINRQR